MPVSVIRTNNNTMKEQKLITHHTRHLFDREVNDQMKEGWKVVPGTLVCAVCPNGNDTIERWAVVLEK